MNAVSRSLADLLAYLRHPEARRALRQVGAPPAVSLDHAERARAAYAALPFEGLATTSLALAGVTTTAQPPAVTVAIGEIVPGAVFAGIHTALQFSSGLARRLGMPLRVVMLDPTSRGNSAAAVARWLDESLNLGAVDVVERGSIPATRFAVSDIWVATHSKTAHAIQVACIAGRLEPAQVVYLIQDYEPGFSPWSTEFVTAASTYHAGFLPIVNSRPLARYLTAAEGIVVDESQVFAPALELDRLAAAASSRRRRETIRVLFYARRTKPRNLYGLGIATLRSAVAALDDRIRIEFVSAGEPHAPVDLGGDHALMSQGRLAWDSYFDYLSTVDVTLSLQMSPHPSHPPLDTAVSGALAVTNEFDGGRAGLHPGIRVASPDPRSLGAVLAATVLEAADSPPGRYSPLADGVLGHPLDQVLDGIAGQISPR